MWLNCSRGFDNLSVVQLKDLLHLEELQEPFSWTHSLQSLQESHHE